MGGIRHVSNKELYMYLINFCYRVKVLDTFYHCSVQIGDKAKYIIKCSDNLTETPPKGNLIPDIVHVNESTITTKPLHINALKTGSGVATKVEQIGAVGAETGDADKTPENTGNEMETDEQRESDNDFEDVDSNYEDLLDGENLTDPEQHIQDNEISKTNTIPKSSSKTKKTQRLKKRGKKRKVKPETLFKNSVSCTPGSLVAVEICYTYTCAKIKWQVSKSCAHM